MKHAQDLAITIICWKICAQYVYHVIPLTLSRALFSFLHARSKSIIYLDNFPHLLSHTGDEETPRAVRRTLSLHQYFRYKPHLKYQRNILCHSLHLPHTLGWAVRKCSLQCLFHQIRDKEMAPTPSDSQTDDGWRRHAGRQENKKNTVTVISAEKHSQVCILHNRMAQI